MVVNHSEITEFFGTLNGMPDEVKFFRAEAGGVSNIFFKNLTTILLWKKGIGY